MPWNKANPADEYAARLAAERKATAAYRLPRLDWGWVHEALIDAEAFNVERATAYAGSWREPSYRAYADTYAAVRARLAAVADAEVWR